MQIADSKAFPETPRSREISSAKIGCSAHPAAVDRRSAPARLAAAMLFGWLRFVMPYRRISASRLLSPAGRPLRASRLQLRLADGESLLGVNSVRSAATDYPTIYGSAIRSPATRKAPSIAGSLTWCVACPKYGRCGRFAGIVHIDPWLIAGIACRVGRCFSWQDGSRALQSASRIISSVD